MTLDDERRLAELAMTMRSPHLHALLQIRRHNEMPEDRWNVYAIEVLARALDQMTRTAIEFAQYDRSRRLTIIEPAGAHNDDQDPQRSP